MNKIIYIGGIGHSGSTLLDIILGEAANAMSCGQVGGIIDKTIDDNCACGKPIKDCPIWSDIFKVYLEKNWRSVFSRISKERNLLKFLFSKNYCREYVTINDQIFRHLFEISKKQILIDSSKNISRGIAFVQESNYELYFLHLIRDSRGYINSYNKRQVESNEKVGLIKPFLSWLIKNTSASILGRFFYRKRYFQIKYEDLVTKPVDTIDYISSKTGIEKKSIISRIKNHEEFNIRHIFSGNRISKHPVVLKTRNKKTYKLHHFRDSLFWYSLGFITKLWGYSK